MPQKSSKTTGLTDTWGRRNRRHADRSCKECGKTFRPRVASSTYCSVPCARKKNGGHNKTAECWWINNKRYIDGKVWEGGKQRRVKQHRYFMEKFLGRPLLASEDVHHKNGVRHDNRLKNLEVILHSEHSRHHNEHRTYKKGYKLNLSQKERKARSKRMKAIRRAAIAKASATVES